LRKILMATAALAGLSVPAFAQQGQNQAQSPIQPVDLPASQAAEAAADEEYSPISDVDEADDVVTPGKRMDPRDEAIVRSVPDRREIEDVSHAAGRMADAILDTPVGPLREAIEGRRLNRRERQETLGDRAAKDDPYFRERMRDQIGVASVAVGALAEQMAVMAPVLRQTLEDVERRVEDAARGVPPRDYDRRYDPDRD
jgi:hypothetical protein